MFVLAVVLKSFGGLAKIWVLWTSPQSLQMFEFFKVLYIDGLMLGWIIYGNILFYSPQNDCDKVEGTQGMYKLMLMFIVLGYMMVVSYIVIIITNRCLCIVSHEPTFKTNHQNIMKSLSSEIFTPEEFSHEERCAICITDFVEDKDMITKLPCDSRHYFHTVCLSKWI